MGHGDPLFAACLADLDTGVGRVLEKLKTQGLEKNTHIVFTSDNGGVNVTITTAGWYRLQHAFEDAAGSLAVTMSVIDANDVEIYSIVRTTPADLIATVVGGNRYGWMIYNTTGDLAVDNTRLLALAAMPEPASMSLLLVAGAAMLRRRRRMMA